jgi:hypothetical protein
MNENTFAKLFEVKDHQVLVTKTYNSENEEHNIIQFTLVDGIQVSVKASFIKEDGATEAFNNFNQENAETFFDSILKMMQ